MQEQQQQSPEGSTKPRELNQKRKPVYEAELPSVPSYGLLVPGIGLISTLSNEFGPTLFPTQRGRTSKVKAV